MLSFGNISSAFGSVEGVLIII